MDINKINRHTVTHSVSFEPGPGWVWEMDNPKGGMGRLGGEGGFGGGRDTSFLPFAPHDMGEGILPRADIRQPDELDAYFVGNFLNFDWYVTGLGVSVDPPAKKKIDFIKINLEFTKVNKIGAWQPNDVFSSYKKDDIEKKIDIKFSPTVPQEYQTILPKELLPQLDLEYQRKITEQKTPQDSVIRSSSDGQKSLNFEYLQDKKTRIDPRQASIQILFGFRQNTTLKDNEKILNIDTTCKCDSRFSKKSESQNAVSIYFHS